MDYSLEFIIPHHIPDHFLDYSLEFIPHHILDHFLDYSLEYDPNNNYILGYILDYGVDLI